MHNVTECQQRLISLGYLAALNEKGERNDDGKFGERSLDAYNHFRASKGKPPVVQTSMAELNADLFPEEQPAAPVKSPSIFDQLGALLSLVSILKGKTMTADQITGVLRAILALVSGYFIGKGFGSADMWNWIIAGVTGVVPFIWTWISNRPKTIVPLSQKLSQ